MPNDLSGILISINLRQGLFDKVLCTDDGNVRARAGVQRVGVSFRGRGAGG
jgi:hypothetical protein